ncbi:serpin 2 [Arabidopsis thaliana]|uniref:Serpin-Z2 n=1 Tax=Arabidopsis thaliana TaxID=3702 RepID=SPZ2_ARATH|nr:serpin 2 [Arabidopsis thaliana]Q9ZQR6.1 RecName: Full=Serpin-Z2; AltName: Full=ArathZ2 [Arabidopsis thaliana]AAD15462.1 putative serpin [Arabidopsis thaliana]AAL59941.1 putative serpin protein [Arabidopsis thaliana]AAM67475.1 putative serpin protein [Arabidopsis thaliana]AEC06310.1 serpin 2 [Arabidopsis thaliana]|eukprot:NP_179060.1 serpin 2 [Arabidopsis thaliana]
MDSKRKNQELSTSETADPSLSKTNKKQKIDMQEAMKNQNEVSLLLVGKVISAVAKNSNCVFSPASINAVLTVTAANTDNKTLRSFILSFLKSSSTEETNAIFHELASVVFKDGSETGGPKIAAVNGVWMEQSLSCNPDWEDLFLNFFKASFAKVDFRHKAEEVRLDVNTWASRHTNDLIKEILPRGSVTSLTNWIYGNALYFKGAWEKAFDKSMTRDKPFHLLNGKSVSVPFMRSYEKQFIEAYDGFKVLRLPYRQGRDDTNREFSMYLYLPDKKGELDNLLERITSNPGFLDSHIPEYRVDVGDFRIPKFKIEFGFEASSVFNDFELNVSLHQKALIEIDEEGTEAAAATTVVVVTGSCLWEPKKKIDFVADHPFLFLIREDKTGTLLFAGQIFDPSELSSALDRA